MEEDFYQADLIVMMNWMTMIIAEFIQGNASTFFSFFHSSFKYFRFAGDNFSKNLKIVEEFKNIASQLDLTISQVVLSWILSQGDDFFVIPGTTNVSR